MKFHTSAAAGRERPALCRVLDHPTVAAFHIFIFSLPSHPAIISAVKFMPVSLTMAGFSSKNFLTKI
jgi:hypothetical protein